MSAPTIAAVIVAAGSSSRMGQPKQWIDLQGMPVLGHTLRVFATTPAVTSVTVVTREEDIDRVKSLWRQLACDKPLALVPGGVTRQQSVSAGVNAVPQKAELIAIHDGARPFVTAEMIVRVAAVAAKTGGASAAVRVKDTVKQTDDAGVVVATPDRRALWNVQTPQIFLWDLYLSALKQANDKGLDLTDDCGLMEAFCHPPVMVEGDYRNIKITTPEDVAVATAFLAERSPSMRIGHGYDVHRLVEGRELILGGVTIPHETGLLGHSDADVLLHAIMDGLLGAAALGDIGTWFPDTDAAYKGVDSGRLLQETVKLISSKGYTVGNIDATLLCQAPKLKPHIPQMRENIAAWCGITTDQVSVKATTEEGLGFTGEKLGIAAHAVCLLMQ